MLGIAFIVGVQNIVFWTVVTFIASMLPLVGALIIWLPALIYLLVVAQPVAALALFALALLAGCGPRPAAVTTHRTASPGTADPADVADPGTERLPAVPMLAR